MVPPEKSLWVQRFQNAEVGRIARVLSAVLKIKSTLFTNHKHMATFTGTIYTFYFYFFLVCVAIKSLILNIPVKQLLILFRTK